MHKPLERAPAVSIVTPCFNAEHTLARTLESVLAQSFEDYEWIVVNDGSTDSSKAVLKAYADRFGGRLTIIDQPNGGQTVAKNAGLARTRGEFIALLDADDLWHPDKLTKQVTFMRTHRDLGMSYTQGLYIDPSDRVIGPLDSDAAYRGHCFTQLLLKNDIVASSVMVRRTAIEAVGNFDSELRACENWELWTRIAHRFPIDRLEERLTLYRQHPANMSRNLDKMRTYRLMTVRKNEARYAGEAPAVQAALQQSLFEAYAFFGSNYLWQLDTRSARADLLRAIRMRPTQAGLYVKLAKSCLGPRALEFFRRVKNRPT
jgi:glycosyltransferase involved in cell wall biosynthesis